MDDIELLLAKLNTNNSWEVRSQAIKQLGALRDSHAIKPLLAILDEPRHGQDLNRDTNEYVRSVAAAVLGDFGDKEVVSPLIKALIDDRYWEVREAAAGSLGVLKDNCAIEPLIQTLADVDEKVQYAAAVALQQFPANEIAEKLEENRPARGWAEWILGHQTK